MSALPEEDHEDGESKWRFAVDEVGEEAEAEADPDPDVPEPIEPETPTLENSVFVLLGVVLSVLIFYTAVGGL
jgi:hypothetical protein